MKRTIGNATLYLGDCRDILPTLDKVDAVITDPVWPNALPQLAGSGDPSGLFAEAAAMFPADRLAVQLGCNSDPRFLTSVPASFPFFRAVWLEYAAPHYMGRLLYTGDVAYLFGPPPPSKKGAHVIPGKKVSIARYGREVSKDEHPCARRLEHVEWLVQWFSAGTVLDPFMGSGTTGVACVKRGAPFVGIEVNPDFYEVACRRIEDAQRQERLFA